LINSYFELKTNHYKSAEKTNYYSPDLSF